MEEKMELYEKLSLEKELSEILESLNLVIDPNEGDIESAVEYILMTRDMGEEMSATDWVELTLSNYPEWFKKNHDNLSEEDIINSIDDSTIDDEDRPAKYQIWRFDFEDELIVDETLVAEFSDLTEAVVAAKAHIASIDAKALKNDVEFVVETVVDFGDYEENIDSVYSILIKKEI